MNRLRRELGGAGSIFENAELLHAEIQDLDATRWEELKALQSEVVPHQISIRVEDAASADGHDLLQDSFDADLNYAYRLVCVKAPVSRVLRFFCLEHFSTLVRRDPGTIEAVDTVYVADLTSRLNTVGVSIEIWNGCETAPIKVRAVKSPREFITDATGLVTVPKSVAPWLHDGDGHLHKQIFGNQYGRRLALAVPTSVLSGADGGLIALADVKRKIAAEIEPVADPIWEESDLLDQLVTTAKWIYFDGADVENRHSIIAAEIARSFPKDVKWGAGLKIILDNALDSAKIAYRLHLYDKSIDALKLMSDLRKSLADDVKSVSTQTSTLAAGLWRDAAVAVGAVAVKSLTGVVGPLILGVTAAYLVVSWYLNSRSSKEAVQAISQNERVFRSKLYGPILANDEYKELAGDRYAAVIDDFYGYRRLVTFVYWAAIALVIGVAIWPHTQDIASYSSCASNHFARYVGRAGMPDAIPLWPMWCGI